jgi:hypothetical protein
VTGRIRDNALLFEATVRGRVKSLSPEARGALQDLLVYVRQLATANAAVALVQKKWMMHAYWRVVAVYARHLYRFLRP